MAPRSCPGHHQFGHVRLMSLHPSSPVFRSFTGIFIPHPLVAPLSSSFHYKPDQNETKPPLDTNSFSSPICFLSFLPSLLLPERPAASIRSVPFISQSSVLVFLPPRPTQHTRTHACMHARTHTHACT